MIAWAREAGAWIVEDDYASEFRYGGRPLTSLQGLDTAERTIYVGTLNRALFPGLRTCYLIAPGPLLQRFVTVRYLMDRQPPSLQQEVPAAFIGEGHLHFAYTPHARALSRPARPVGRYTAAPRGRVPGGGAARPGHASGGVSAPEPFRFRGRAGRARRRRRRPSCQDSTRARPRQGLLLGFSGYPAASISPAVWRLAKALRRVAG